MAVNASGKVDAAALRSSLQHLGYKLDDQEADELFAVVDVDRCVAARGSCGER